MTKKLLLKKNGFKLYAVIITKGSKQRVGVMLYQESKNGEISVPNIVQRSDLLKKSKVLQDLLNLSICLTEEELDGVIKKAIALLESADQVEQAENIDIQSTPSQLYKAICEHGKEVTSELIIDKESEEPKWMIWLDNGYLNIRTTDFEDFLNEIPEADDYKKPEILRTLKLMGVLDTDAGRAYDKKVSKDNKKWNVYRIIMPKRKGDKGTAKEVVPVEVVEESKAEAITAEPKTAETLEAMQITIEEVLKEEAKADELQLEPKPVEPVNSEEENLGGFVF